MNESSGKFLSNHDSYDSTNGEKILTVPIPSLKGSNHCEFILRMNNSRNCSR